MDFVVYAIPFFLLALAIELAWDRWRGTGYYRMNDTLNSLSLGLISTTSKLVLIDIAGKVYSVIQQHYSLSVWQQLNVWHWIFAFLVYDLCYYWFHRISHERKLFWAAHVAHHQSEEYNLSTALRQTSMSFLLSWVFYIPCFVLGMPAEVFVSVASLNLIYQFWVHTRFVPELGPVEWFFVTPSNHRVHHARNPGYIDKNYGGVFIIWDRLFGSYCREQSGIAVDYGITRGLNSWNPLWANVHVYWGMFKHSLQTQRWQDKVKVWLGPTVFVPDDIEQGELRLGKQYNPPLNNKLRVYVLLQFLLVVAIGVLLKYQSSELGEERAVLLFLYMVFSLVVLGWLLEGRRIYVELVRLLLAPLVGFIVLGSISWLLLAVSLLCMMAVVLYQRQIT